MQKQQPHSPLANYRGKWVALAPGTHDEVIASGTTLSEAHRAAIARGRDDAVLHLVPQHDAYFIG